MMNNKRKQPGFSLTEVLIAVGILSVGMTFVAGVFPAGIYLMTIATERTIAAVAADEAFAKVKIYAIGDLYNTTDDVDLTALPTNAMMDFNDSIIFPATTGITTGEFEYPSADTGEPNQYCWSALCRKVENDPNRLVQVTVFVCRKISPNLEYRNRNPDDTLKKSGYPVPVRVSVSQTGNPDELSIVDINPADGVSEKTFVNDGYTIVDDVTGRIYRVLERYKAPNDDTILLNGDWEGGSPGDVWVVPPPVGGGRYPCITVYQKLIRF